MRNVDALLFEAEDLVMTEIEKQVVKILLCPKNRADGFVMAMGGYCFYSKGDNLDECVYMEPVYKIFEEYDHVFKLSGQGVRWDLVDGKIKKQCNW